MNFDWDDVSLDHPQVIRALSELNSEFGFGRVWYRISSSGTGLHVIIADVAPNLTLLPLTFDDDFVFSWRQKLSAKPYGLECSGRLRADQERFAHGFRIGRIFSTKNNLESGPWQLFCEESL